MAIDRPRLHCHHTARQHYLMFHRDCDSSYGNSVFNYTYNIQGCNMLSGNMWTTLKAGFSWALGTTLGRFIFGSFANPGGCFGGGFDLSPWNAMTTTPFSLYGNSYLNNSANFWSIPSRNNNTESPKSPKPSTPDNKTAAPNEKTDAPKTLTNEELADLIKNAGDDPKKLQELLDPEKYNLNNEQKTKIKDKIKELNEAAAKKTPEDAETEAEPKKKAEEVKTKQEQDKINRAKSYLNGYKNATSNELNSINNLNVIDTSGLVNNINDALIQKVENNQIEIKTSSGITVKYKLITTTKFGEEVYMSNKNHQHYILQKDSKGDFSLVQYNWHHGHGVADIVENNRNQDNGFPNENTELKEDEETGE